MMTDLRQFPLTSKATIYSSVLSAGEVIYVPGGSAHQVNNRDMIVATSMNFVDELNLQKATRLMYDMDEETSMQLQDKDFPRGLFRNQQHLRWDLFKKWPNTDQKPDFLLPKQSVK